MSWPQDYALPPSVWPYPLPSGWGYREAFREALYLVRGEQIIHSWTVTATAPTREQVVADTLEELMVAGAMGEPRGDGEGDW